MSEANPGATDTIEERSIKRQRTDDDDSINNDKISSQNQLKLNAPTATSTGTNSMQPPPQRPVAAPANRPKPLEPCIFHNRSVSDDILDSTCSVRVCRVDASLVRMQQGRRIH